MKAVIRIQDEILSALRDHLRGIGFIEILAPIIGPVTDPGIRGAISGGEREYKYERVVRRMLSMGEAPEAYKWYLQMLKEGTTPSAGFGIAVERLTRYIYGEKYIWDAVPFPKVPGIVSP